MPSVDHWPRFTHFVAAETAAGGPDCQLTLLTELVPSDTSPIEKVWLNGCYAAHHCVPSAYAVWKHWRPEDAAHHESDLEKWLRDHWNALPVRPEMRSHRMPSKRARCLSDFAQYALYKSWTNLQYKYDDLWTDSIDQVKYYSRYMALKYLTLLQMTVRPDLELRDIRAKHAWSPRITLGLLFPEHAAIVADRDNNSQTAIFLAEQCAKEALERLHHEKLMINWYQLQVLTCNYREMLNGGFYPGAGHDEEMDYIKLSETRFLGTMSHLWNTRKRIFKPQYLGEENDWFGLRQERFQYWKNHPDFPESR